MWSVKYKSPHQAVTLIITIITLFENCFWYLLQTLGQISASGSRFIPALPCLTFSLRLRIHLSETKYVIDLFCFQVFIIFMYFPEIKKNNLYHNSSPEYIVVGPKNLNAKLKLIRMLLFKVFKTVTSAHIVLTLKTGRFFLIGLFQTLLLKIALNFYISSIHFIERLFLWANKKNTFCFPAFCSKSK